MKNEDRISWTRPYGKNKDILTSEGEFVRYVSTNNNQAPKAVIILDAKLVPTTVLVSQLKKISR